MPGHSLGNTKNMKKNQMLRMKPRGFDDAQNNRNQWYTSKIVEMYCLYARLISLCDLAPSYGTTLKMPGIGHPKYFSRMPTLPHFIHFIPSICCSTSCLRRPSSSRARDIFASLARKADRPTTNSEVSIISSYINTKPLVFCTVHQSFTISAIISIDITYFGFATAPAPHLTLKAFLA